MPAVTSEKNSQNNGMIDDFPALEIRRWSWCDLSRSLNFASEVALRSEPSVQHGLKGNVAHYRPAGHGAQLSPASSSSARQISGVTVRI
jgi:hypothetical protein